MVFISFWINNNLENPSVSVADTSPGGGGKEDEKTALSKDRAEIMLNKASSFVSPPDLAPYALAQVAGLHRAVPSTALDNGYMMAKRCKCFAEPPGGSAKQLRCFAI